MFASASGDDLITAVLPRSDDSSNKDALYKLFSEHLQEKKELKGKTLFDTISIKTDKSEFERKIYMNKWVTEDWQFELSVINGKAAHCRLGLETGDTFIFSYECPKGICPRVMSDIFTWCEVIRCGGDFTKRGEKDAYEMNISCPCHCIHFHLKASPINRDENGKALPNNPRPAE